MTFQPLGQRGLPASFALPTYRPDRLTHILLGDYAAVIEAINRMDVLRYCDRVVWIEPIPTGRSGEYISVMTRRLVTPND
ncbi:hypothetical protein C7293_15375 [filamentous cyanobacterium CCT1]|nr:hypothetical protein C7293_15375 [filamentous cyanobacterium CCT1]PSN76182.1 hypothetical protein C8B47_28620 [filamentous cyanobacterium CCP4]